MVTISSAMETEELIKLVDGIYKNILDKFNPGARQMINAGKAYLKALHGAAAASRLYIDAINKLARQAQQGTWGGCSDVGMALMKIVQVYKEIQDQQMNILKAFYVDLLVPLETNLEKDTKVVQSEQKRFLQQHKQRTETFSKAAAMMKKQRKKSRGSTKTGLAMDKELKNMQVLEEEKTKLDAFCEQSLKNAMTQERRRYGFVLERQCSLAKHYLSYHTHGANGHQQNLEQWSEVAKTREFLPDTVENIFSNRLRQISVWQDEDVYANPRSPHFDDDGVSIASQLRKTKSMDASCLDIRSIGDAGSPVTTLLRAKSEYNLNSSTHSLEQDATPTRRPKSMAVPPVPPPQWDTQLARALYAYLSSGENQLSFLEGDLIALIGERNKGWQFGENLRTQASGWFPLAYTEFLDDSSASLSPTHHDASSVFGNASAMTSGNTVDQEGMTSPSGNIVDLPTPRMFGDTLHLHKSSASAKQVRRAIGSNNIPPPALPAPVPTATPYLHPSGMTQSQSTNFTSKSPYAQAGIKSSASSFNFSTPSSGTYSTHPQPSRSDSRPTAPLPLHLQTKATKPPVGNASLHSSNDSGFSNDPPPQPEIDYSDDDSVPRHQAKNIRHRREVSSDDNNNRQCVRAPIRQSNSSGNLIDKRYYISDNDTLSYMAGERRGIVKRTKSFWRFGRNTSDDEILEGMALWKHRDLVDVDDEIAYRAHLGRSNEKSAAKSATPIEKIKKPSRDASNDSERTLLNVRNYETDEKQTQTLRKSSEAVRRAASVRENKVPPPAVAVDQVSDVSEFYDGDDGASSATAIGIRMVNRKNILQQYTNDESTGPDSESESEMTSDDPYDCILVDDQTQKVRQDAAADFPNVAALGRKLEKLSKNTKYTPNRPNISNQIHNEIEKNHSRPPKHDEKMREQREHQRSTITTFKTFGHETQNNENGEKEHDAADDSCRYKYAHSQNRKRNNESSAKDKRRYYAVADSNGHNNLTQERTRQSYDSLDSQIDEREKRNERNAVRRTNTDIKKEALNYRESSADTAAENRQFHVPRTKLNKNNNSKGSLTDYGETLPRRIKMNEYAPTMDEKLHHNGNMYGPWYDLWGLDASVRK